jgi:hypothetical protein
MFELLLLAAFLFFLACAAWVVSIAVSAVFRTNKLWHYGVRDLFVFSAVTALTMAMAVSLYGEK